MAKARPYWLKSVQMVPGKRAALALAEDLRKEGLYPKIYPGNDPKCRANHSQPGFGGKLDQVCPECGGYNYV